MACSVPSKTSNYEGLLAPQLVDDIDSGAEKWEPTDDRFDNEDLIEREASMGRSNFMLQFMLDTSLSDADKFPLNALTLSLPLLTLSLLLSPSSGAQTQKTLSRNSQLSDYLEIISTVQCSYKESGTYAETICSVDPSGRGSDETTAAYLSQRNGILYLHEMRAY